MPAYKPKGRPTTSTAPRPSVIYKALQPDQTRRSALFPATPKFLPTNVPSPASRDRHDRSAPAAIPTFRGFSAAEQAIMGSPNEGLIRDIVNYGSTYGPVVGPTTAQNALSDFMGGGYGGGGGGGGGGGPAVLPELAPIDQVKWKQGTFNLQDHKTPSWWKSLVPENAADMERPDVAYVAMLNTMIPYLSPEDQKRAAGLIYSTVGGAHFGHYEQSEIQVPATKELANLTPGYTGPVIDTQYYQSASRASGAVDALSQLRQQTVGGEREKIGGTGIGYRFLQNLLEQVKSFGGKTGEGQTRSQQLAMQGALDPIMASAQTSEVGPVGAIAQMLSQPFFSQGNLYPFSKQGGRVFFGQPNPVLFG